MDMVALHDEALGFVQNGRWQEAVPLLKSLLDQSPDYEHGAPWYDLACCHDELGEVAEARRCYERALGFDPMSPIFLGGLASHLYRHGTPEEALAAFTRYLQAVGENSELGRKVRPAVENLKRKIG
jgi:Flp pilus assembly protein TadD